MRSETDKHRIEYDYVEEMICIDKFEMVWELINSISPAIWNTLKLKYSTNYVGHSFFVL